MVIGNMEVKVQQANITLENVFALVS
jgi:hypothetical protein